MHEYLAFIDGCHVPPFDVFTVFGTSLCTFVSLLSSGLVLHPLGVFAILRTRCTVPPSIESIARKDDWTYSNMMYTVYCILIYITYIYIYIHSTYWYLEVVNGFELARTWAYLLKLIYLSSASAFKLQEPEAESPETTETKASADVSRDTQGGFRFWDRFLNRNDQNRMRPINYQENATRVLWHLWQGCVNGFFFCLRGVAASHFYSG